MSIFGDIAQIAGSIANPAITDAVRGQLQDVLKAGSEEEAMASLRSLGLDHLLNDAAAQPLSPAASGADRQAVIDALQAQLDALKAEQDSHPTPAPDAPATVADAPAAQASGQDQLRQTQDAMEAVSRGLQEQSDAAKSVIENLHADAAPPAQVADAGQATGVGAGPTASGEGVSETPPAPAASTAADAPGSPVTATTAPTDAVQAQTIADALKADEATADAQRHQIQADLQQKIVEAQQDVTTNRTHPTEPGTRDGYLHSDAAAPATVAEAEAPAAMGGGATGGAGQVEVSGPAATPAPTADAVTQVGASVDQMETSARELMQSPNPADQARGQEQMHQAQEAMEAVSRGLQEQSDAAKSVIENMHADAGAPAGDMATGVGAGPTASGGGESVEVAPATQASAVMDPAAPTDTTTSQVQAQQQAQQAQEALDAASHAVQQQSDAAKSIIENMHADAGGGGEVAIANVPIVEAQSDADIVQASVDHGAVTAVDPAEPTRGANLEVALAGGGATAASSAAAAPAATIAADSATTQASSAAASTTTDDRDIHGVSHAQVEQHTAPPETQAAATAPEPAADPAPDQAVAEAVTGQHDDAAPTTSAAETTTPPAETTAWSAAAEPAASEPAAAAAAEPAAAEHVEAAPAAVEETTPAPVEDHSAGAEATA